MDTCPLEGIPKYTNATVNTVVMHSISEFVNVWDSEKLLSGIMSQKMMVVEECAENVGVEHIQYKISQAVMESDASTSDIVRL